MELQKDYQKEFGNARNVKRNLHLILIFYLRKNKFKNQIKTKYLNKHNKLLIYQNMSFKDEKPKILITEHSF